MERHEAAMAIAVVNKISKMVYSNILLKKGKDLEHLLSANIEFPALAAEIVTYLQEDTDPRLFNQLLNLVETKSIIAHINTLKDSLLKIRLEAMVTAIEELRKAARQFERMGQEHPGLDDTLSTETIISLLNRARDAGYLDDDYQPTSKVKNYQLYIIALAVINIAGLKPRDSWWHFDKLWDRGRDPIARCRVPLTKSHEIYKIAMLYPEFNILAHFKKTDPNHLFVSPFTEKQAKYLAKCLREMEYLDKNTPDESFLAIQGLMNVPVTKVNWVGPAYSLAYFVQAAFSDLNLKIWTLTASLFTLQGDPINKETFKSKSHVLKTHADRYEFIPTLDELILRVKQK